jgi:GTPase
MRVALIGRPNVGKSTLFNRLIGKHLAITAKESGTTRDRIEHEISLNRVRFTLTDVGGITTVATGPLDSNIQAQVQYALQNSDLLIFLVDAKNEITSEDSAIAEMLRRTKKPLFFIANKFENNDSAQLMNFTSFGFGVPLGISAIHYTGFDEFTNLLAKKIREIKKKLVTKQNSSVKKITANLAIVGRPNVGKSSLINKILGSNRFVISAEPCTTRDTNDTLVEFEEKIFRFCDTAGLRRAGKIGIGIDRFATGRTLNAISEAEIALLLLDGTEKVVAQDLHVAEKVLRAGCGLILVVNKTDHWEDFPEEQEKWLANLQTKFAFAPHLPVVMVSAKTGKNLTAIFPRILDVLAARQKRISTPIFNRFIKKIIAEHPPARKKDTAKSGPKIFYATQLRESNLTFVFFVNRSQSFHFSWRRFCENRLREEFGFAGNPIKLEFRPRREKLKISATTQRDSK